ncbi:MAG TPA: hypothetical protein VLM76_09850 [Patescibacteria group bacterium]|nr:hypothetical protein [Patescibacteria group bacterium]
MMHRSHRPPATVPARRGMRAAWFRDRTIVEPAAAPETGPPAHDGATPEPALPAPGLPVRPARAAFGHPTF